MVSTICLVKYLDSKRSTDISVFAGIHNACRAMFRLHALLVCRRSCCMITAIDSFQGLGFCFLWRILDFFILSPRSERFWNTPKSVFQTWAWNEPHLFLLTSHLFGQGVWTYVLFCPPPPHIHISLFKLISTKLYNMNLIGLKI